MYTLDYNGEMQDIIIGVTNCVGVPYLPTRL